MNFASLPTIEQVNLEKYWDIVRRLDPEFFLLKIALEETGVNPLILPKIIRSIHNLAIGTGSGKIQIFMEKTIITSVKGEETDLVKEKAIVDKEG